MTEPIYANTVDSGRFTVAVNRLGPSRGTLTVHEGDAELLSETVSLAYEARFGPDVDDVTTWRNRAIQVIDDHLIELGEQIPEPTTSEQPRKKRS